MLAFLVIKIYFRVIAYGIESGKAVNSAAPNKTVFLCSHEFFFFVCVLAVISSATWFTSSLRRDYDIEHHLRLVLLQTIDKWLTA
jgi:hypothetical protein